MLNPNNNVPPWSEHEVLTPWETIVQHFTDNPSNASVVMRLIQKEEGELNQVQRQLIEDLYLLRQGRFQEFNRVLQQ